MDQLVRFRLHVCYVRSRQRESDQLVRFDPDVERKIMELLCDNTEGAVCWIVIDWCSALSDVYIVEDLSLDEEAPVMFSSRYGFSVRD